MLNSYLLTLIFDFIFYSFIGWLLETLYGTIKRRSFVNRGFLYGPFCPMYGFGTILLIVSTGFLINNILLLFIFSVVITSTLEYFTGYILEKLFKATWWDYSSKPFNIKGRICLSFSIIWGALSVVFLKFIHPHTMNLYIYMPKILLYPLLGIIIVYLIVDFVWTLNNVLKLTNMLKQFNDIYEDFKLTLEDTADNIENAKEEFKTKYDEMLNKLVQDYPKIFNAFPRFNHKCMRNIKNEICNNSPESLNQKDTKGYL